MLDTFAPLTAPSSLARQRPLSITIPPPPSHAPIPEVVSGQVHGCACAREQSSEVTSLTPFEPVEHDAPPPYSGDIYFAPPQNPYAPYSSLNTSPYHAYDHAHLPYDQHHYHPYANHYAHNPMYPQPLCYHHQMHTMRTPSYPNEEEQHEHHPPYPFSNNEEARQQQLLREYHAALPPMYPYGHQSIYGYQGYSGEWAYDPLVTSQYSAPPSSPSYSSHYSESTNTSNRSFRSALNAKNLRFSLGLAFIRLKSKFNSAVSAFRFNNGHIRSATREIQSISAEDEQEGNSYPSYLQEGTCTCAAFPQDQGYAMPEYDYDTVQAPCFQEVGMNGLDAQYGPSFQELDTEDEPEICNTPCGCRGCKAARDRKIVRRSRGGRRKYRRIISRRRRVAGFKISRLGALASNSIASASATTASLEPVE